MYNYILLVGLIIVGVLLYDRHNPDVSAEFIQSCMVANKTSESWIYENNVLCINGIISSITLYAFEEDMVQREIDVIILNSGGGTKYGGDIVSELIRERNLNIFVPEWAKCISNCVMLLAAGNIQTVEYGAQIGVHYVYKITGNHITISKDMTTWYFNNIGNKQLYDDYKEYMTSTDIISYDEIYSELDIEKPSSFASESIMYVPVTQLRRYGIINQ